MVKLKFCGITREEDYQKAVELEADFIGFVFYPRSLRFIPPAKAKGFIHPRPRSHKVVGVFVNCPLREVGRIKEDLGLDIAQLHADEDLLYCNQIKIPYWKVIQVKRELDLRSFEKFQPAAFLLDKKKKDTYGGTGETFNWKSLDKKIFQERKIILAGGINLSNIDRALALNPYAVDINSGVETEAGIKDHALMEKIANLIKSLA